MPDITATLQPNMLVPPRRIRQTVTGGALIAAMSLTIAACSGSSGSSPSQPKPAEGSSISTAAQTSAAAPATKPTSLTASGLLAGTAKIVKLPAGAAGKISVIEVAKLNKTSAGATLPIIIRNNTSAAISHVEVTGVAKVGSKISQSGTSQGTDPAQI